MNLWKDCKHILCIRPDNMGDLLMSSPAIRAIKETFNCKISVLVSDKGAEVARLIPSIDEVISCNLPWLKHSDTQNSSETLSLVHTLKAKQFDGCIVFNVYSQNPVPSIMLAYLADIPLRAAYCRENLYGLLTDWLPDPEPYHDIIHQVQRDLRLAGFIGAFTQHDSIHIQIRPQRLLQDKLKQLALEPKQYFILHPGVSEAKREYPVNLWIELGQHMIKKYGIPIVLTGNDNDRSLLMEMQKGIGYGAFPVTDLNVEELSSLISTALVMVAVNTGPVHLTSAVQTPVVVLYAQTNPQHHPWKVKSKVLEFSVDEINQSKNEVIRFVNNQFYQEKIPYPSVEMIDAAIESLMG